MLTLKDVKAIADSLYDDIRPFTSDTYTIDLEWPEVWLLFWMEIAEAAQLSSTGQ